MQLLLIALGVWFALDLWINFPRNRNKGARAKLVIRLVADIVIVTACVIAVGGNFFL